jgi:hypothetical protein
VGVAELDGPARGGNGTVNVVKGVYPPKAAAPTGGRDLGRTG